MYSNATENIPRYRLSHGHLVTWHGPCVTEEAEGRKAAKKVEPRFTPGQSINVCLLEVKIPSNCFVKIPLISAKFIFRAISPICQSC